MSASTRDSAAEHMPETKSEPLVSVVIPSCRGGRLLREALASVQAQTLADLEIVVVLDGCDDDLSEVENDQRVRTVRQKRRGASIARNVGVTQARADLIAFLDDDDRMLPERLSAQLEVMRDETVALCHTACRVIDESGAPKRSDDSTSSLIGSTHEGGNTKRRRPPQWSLYQEFLLGDRGVSLSSVMARKRVIHELGGFNPLLPVAEDLDFVWRIAREHSIVFLSDILTEYRRHSSNTWPGYSLQSLLTQSSGAREARAVLEQHYVAARAVGDAKTMRAARRGRAYLVSGRAAVALERARDAQLRHEHASAAAAFGQALLSSPRGSLRAAWKAVQRGLPCSRTFSSSLRPGSELRQESGPVQPSD
jgi:glycosyltransferase involved in cell wall biosynthesis